MGIFLAQPVPTSWHQNIFCLQETTCNSCTTY